MLRRYTEDAEVYELVPERPLSRCTGTRRRAGTRAVEFFEKAIDRQPDYALAYAGLAAARGCQWFFGILPAEQTIPQGKSRQQPGTGALTTSLADAYLSLAMITFFYDWDWQRAEQHVHTGHRPQSEQR